MALDAVSLRLYANPMGGEASPSHSWLEVNGASLFVEEHGTGTPVLLIHGGLASAALWEPLLPHLSGNLRLILPDSRGHGRSTNPSGQLSYAQIADDVAALIDALNLARPVVGGYSDGGQIALELAARHPEAAGALIVGAAYPEFATTPLREVHRSLLGADDAGTPDIAQLEENLGEFVDLVKSWHPGGDKQWRTLVHQTAPMWLDYEGLLSDTVRTIQAPVLVFTGDRDDLIPLDLMISLYHTLPDAEFAVCPQADHFGPITPERASVFAALIQDFVSRKT